MSGVLLYCVRVIYILVLGVTGSVIYTDRIHVLETLVGLNTTLYKTSQILRIVRPLESMLVMNN